MAISDMVPCEDCLRNCPQAKRARDAAIGRMYATKAFIALQKKIESGQLVEVVRCKDCKYATFQTTANDKRYVICQRYGVPKMLHDYCSYGDDLSKTTEPTTRLVDLILEGCCTDVDTAQELAEYLLANGITFREAQREDP